jgi:prevent-host-death family protein
MLAKTVGAAEFKATCLRLIDEMASDGKPVTITKRGKPVAVLTPAPDLSKPKSLFGAMAGSVLRYDDPFGPATDISDWDAMK